MNKISYDVNNEDSLEIVQEKHDGNVTVYFKDSCDVEYEKISIDVGDMVMLINLYSYVKRYDIQNDFINPYGKGNEYGVTIDNISLTENDLSMISDGILSLIDNASKAYKLIANDENSKAAINDYMFNLQSLNTKVCNLMKMNIKEES